VTGPYVRSLILTCLCCACASSIAHAQTSSTASNRAVVTWTIGGSAGGFGVGLWAGLTAFDDAVDSDRKVWTSAIAGAAIGAAGGYLLGRVLGRPRAKPLRPGSGNTISSHATQIPRISLQGTDPHIVSTGDGYPDPSRVLPSTDECVCFVSCQTSEIRVPS
jgi:hypothetical protein